MNGERDIFMVVLPDRINTRMQPDEQVGCLFIVNAAAFDSSKVRDSCSATMV